MTKLRDKSGRKTLLLGAVLAVATTVLVAYTANATITTGGSPTPAPPVPTAEPTPTPAPEPPQSTVTVTETPAPAPAPVPPTVTTTVQPPPAPTTKQYTPSPSAPRTSTPEPPVGDPPTFTEAGIRADVAGAVSVSQQYWVDLFSGWKDPQGNQVYWAQPSLYHGDGFYDSEIELAPGCGSAYDEENVDNAFYCPDPRAAGFGFMAWDMDFFREGAFLGDTLIYITIAHEMGHAAQERFRVDHEDAAVLTGTDEEELQADCLAGVTIAKVVQDGYLTLEPGDTEEMTDSMLALGDAHSGEGHGTSQQRRDWYYRGYNSNDIEACLGNAS